jgi:hypothetical protein
MLIEIPLINSHELQFVVSLRSAKRLKPKVKFKLIPQCFSSSN